MPLTYYTHARRDEPKVALTFDDGPNPPRTDEIMDILEAKGALVRDGKVLLVQRSPQLRHHPGVWDLMGGRVEGDESLEDALRREALEELQVAGYG